MYYPFKERQYSLLPSFSLEENLPIFKCECRVPPRSASGQVLPCSLAPVVVCNPHWWPWAGDAPCATQGAGGRGQDPAATSGQS